MSEKYLINKNSINNIKSQYFLIFIFSFLDEKRKLEIIKYNKNLQNTLDIKLINYKFYKGTYIIYELNGKIKEYNGNTDKIKFEGEYLNGKRNGKEYDSNGNLIFEGEYKNGLKWNGKGYDNNNNIVYELKNGNGYVKDYPDNCELMFESEYLNGKRNGKGKEYDSQGNLIYDGNINKD